MGHLRLCLGEDAVPRGTLKPSLLLVGTLGTAGITRPLPEGAPSLRPSRQLEAAVRVAESFASAWFAGDAEALQRCLHPELAKRIVQVADGAVLEPFSLAQAAGLPALLGNRTLEARRRREVTVLDLRGRSASLRVEMAGWNAYLHLASTGGGYGIVNVLWEWMGSGMG